MAEKKHQFRQILNRDKTAQIKYLTKNHYFSPFYILFTYFASVIGYEDDILVVISNLHIKGVKFGEKKEK